MTSDDREWSLADQAASWVPPWERATSTEPPEQAEGAESETDAAPGEVDEALAEVDGASGGADAAFGGGDGALADVDAVGEVDGASGGADAALDEVDAALGDAAVGEAEDALQAAEALDEVDAALVDAALGDADVGEAEEAVEAAEALDEIDAALGDADVGGAEDALEAAEADDALAIDEAEEAYAEALADEAAEPLVGGGSSVSVEESFDATLADAVLPDAVPQQADEAYAEALADEAAEPLVVGGSSVSVQESFDATLADAVLPDAMPQQAEEAGPLALVADAELRGALEAILLVLEEPVSEVTLAQVLEQPTERINELLGELADEYESGGRGFELRRAAGGWRFYTRPAYAQYVERFVLDGQQLRLTQAALETLAVVAYKQPVTRSRISAIRGVNCDGVIRTLISRGLVEECGAEPDSGAFLYRTTTLFLEKLGLNSVEELPPLAPFLPDDVDEIADAPR